MRVKGTALLLGRALVIAGCIFSVWRSARFAAADWVARSGSVDSLVKALRYRPDDPRLLARLANARIDAGDQTSAVDDRLRRAATLDPFSSDVLMTLGLREEFRGDHAAAEHDLVRAADIDHQFKPAWTLANYYDRAGQPSKALPMIQRILQLDLADFNLSQLFALSWRVLGDRPAAVFSLIPKKDPFLVQYLEFLENTMRTDAALQVWPAAFAAGDSRDAETFIGFVDYLVNAGRAGAAASVWNQLVDRQLIHSGHLDPSKGASIADPGFQFPSATGRFAWQIAETPEVSSGIFSGSLNLQMSGDEAPSFRILSLMVPVVADRRYRLVWKTDASALRNANDPGFSFRIDQSENVKASESVKASERVKASQSDKESKSVKGSGATIECPPLLTSPACDFHSAAGAGVSAASLTLNYTRAQGTTRSAGTLRLSAVRLELIP